jgi:hypothetical protein
MPSDTDSVQGRRNGRGGSQPQNLRQPAATTSSNKFLAPSTELEPFDFGVDRIASSKFQSAKKKLKDYLGVMFGHNAHIIDHGEEFEFDEPAQPPAAELGADADPHGFKRRMYEKQLDAFVKRVEDYKDNKAKVYAVIWRLCTVTMRHKIMESANFAEFDILKDPLPLWQVITQISLDGLRPRENETKRRREAVERFNRVRQQPNETIGNFYERFRSEYEALEAVGAQLVLRVGQEPENAEEAVNFREDLNRQIDAEIAMNFLFKLDAKRYKNMLDDLENSLTVGRDEYPANLVAAYQMAMNRRESGVKLGGVSSFKEHSIAFVAGAKKSKGPKDPKPQQAKEEKKIDSEVGGGNKSKVKCYFCNNKGHIKTDCPVLKKALKELQKQSAGGAQVTTAAAAMADDGDDDQLAFVTNEELVAAAKQKVLGPRDILCDNEASISIFHNKELLKNLRKSDQRVKVTGIGGSISTNTLGDYKDFGPVYYHPESVANILCFYDLNRRYGIHFDSIANQFNAITPNGSAMVFSPKGKLYVYSDRGHTSEETVLVQTVSKNLEGYTKREIDRMKMAGELYSIHGRPSEKDFIWMLTSGTILNCPVTAADFKRWIHVFGHDIGAVKGKTTRRTPLPVITESHRNDEIQAARQNISLSVDIFFVSGVAFLLSISSFTNMLMVKYLSQRTTKQLQLAIDAMISAHGARGFKVTIIQCDGEGAVAALRTHVEGAGITLNLAARGEHVATIERKIRQVKERVRGFWNTLPFKLTVLLLVYLVYYCVTTINWYPTTTSAFPNVSAREIFLGRKLDYSRDCQLPFGQYVQTHEDADITNSMRERTIGAIAIGPAGNLQGAYNFMSLSTWKVIKRRSWTALPMPEHVVQIINRKAEEEKLAIQGQPTFRLGDNEIPEVDEQDDEPEEEPGPIDPGPQRQVMHELPFQPPVQQAPELLQQPDAITMDHIEDAEVVALEDAQPPEIPVDELPEPAPPNDIQDMQPPHRYDLRPNRSSWRDKYAYAFTNISVKKGVSTIGVPAVLSMMLEIKQLHDKRTFRPVKASLLDMRQRSKIIRSHMFLKRKRDSRLKARLVADGSMQERSTSVDVSSPTVSTEALFLTLAVDAFQKRHVVTVDIEGAYLHADMTSEVFVQFDPIITAILVSMVPSYQEYVDEAGKMIVILDKALYGCIESAKLFYEHISTTLLDYGYTKNPYDLCVFNKVVYSVQSTVTIHVDDLKISCTNRKGIADLITELKRVYRKINVHDGTVIDYLGMDLDYSIPGVCSISMKSLIEEAIDSYHVDGSAKTPAAQYLFQVSESAELLGMREREDFHSTVQRLLYISKRARPDILTAISFLTTRVTRPTIEDQKKLIRVLQYLRGSKDLTLQVSGGDGMFITSFIDSSFGVHPDGKGHTGTVITVGTGAIYCKSGKQKLVAKSSTEAELIGLSDSLSQVLWTRNFLMSQGHPMQPAVIAQDNKSTIALAEKGRSTSGRTRHVSIRYFFVKDRIDSREIEIKYVPSESMIADFFTKPLQGALFVRLRDAILKCDMRSIAGVCSGTEAG